MDAQDMVDYWKAWDAWFPLKNKMDQFVEKHVFEIRTKHPETKNTVFLTDTARWLVYRTHVKMWWIGIRQNGRTFEHHDESKTAVETPTYGDVTIATVIIPIETLLTGAIDQWITSERERLLQAFNASKRDVLKQSIARQQKELEALK